MPIHSVAPEFRIIMKRIKKHITVDRMLLLVVLAIVALHMWGPRSGGIQQPTLGLDYDYLADPEVAEIDIERFTENQRDQAEEYKPLKEQLEKMTATAQGRYAVYFEDLETGAWFGINESDSFRAASLYKVLKLSSVLKRIERRELRFDDRVALNPEDLRKISSTLGADENNIQKSFSIRELSHYLIVKSDNTAAAMLERVIQPIDLAEANMGMGLRLSETTHCTPRHFGNILRSLYTSSYLRRPFSNYALSLMARTEFKDQLPAGLPDGTPIANKVGWFFEEGAFHDCGIVYAGRPYILCVMSRETHKNEADRVISGVSSKVYQYLESGQVTRRRSVLLKRRLKKS